MSRDDRYFRVDANLCAAIPRVVNRAHGLAPRTDVLVLLGLHAYADSLPSWQRTFIDDVTGMKSLRVPYRPAALLQTMEHARDRKSRNDFSSDAWKRVRAATRRLTTANVSVPYTLLDGGRGRRSMTRHLVYEGPLARVGTDGQGAGAYVDLALASGLTSGFFVSIGRDLFKLRGELGDADARLLVWLLRKHRGRTEYSNKRRVLVHNEVVEVEPSDVAEELALHPGHPRRGRDAIVDALCRLEWRDIVALDQRDGAMIRVELNGSVFHGEGR